MRNALAAALLGSALLFASGAAQAQVSEAQARQMIEEAYPVQVLKVTDGEVDGQAAWLLTVMNDGGNYNEAFQVNTLAVSKADGKLLSSFTHGASGYSVPPTISGSPASEINPSQMRNGIWR
jgi:hypothetical protein